MKVFKKILALMIVLAMCLTMSMTVFAMDDGDDPSDPPAQEEPTVTPQPETGEFGGGDFLQTPETTINASGLTPNDTVEVYQLVKWDATTSDWVLNGTCGVTLDELINGITEAEATTIAANVSTAAIDTLPVGPDGTVSYNCADNPGLFYLKAIPAADNKKTVYNPAFVSADYYDGNNTVSFSDTIGSSTVVKKSEVPFDKEVTGSDQFVDTKPGDTIPYKITTTIPSYGTSFQNPVFNITDTLSTGLELQTPIKVKYGNTEIEASDDNVTITPNGTSGFEVSFKKEYLTGLNGNTTNVEITYSAKVTTAAANNVTYMDNKAKLVFSNTPTTTQDKEDITRHYTFSIDANMTGEQHGNERTRELIKIGVDEKGQTINAFTSWVEGEAWTEETPLAGAKFKLEGTGALAGFVQTTESIEGGYISFKGLDAGTYKLTETEAPAGYVRDTSEHTVIITPTYDTPDNPDVLRSYTVSIDGNVSSYTVTNRSDTDATIETTVNEGTSMTFPFVNTKGAELPTTGGTGTRLFYIIGTILVIGAGVLLVSRRRMNRK